MSIWVYGTAIRREHGDHAVSVRDLPEVVTIDRHGPGGEQLTPREQQVVQGIEDGLSYKLIAARLSISVDTVRNFIRIVYRKLPVNSKGEVMALARQRR